MYLLCSDWSIRCLEKEKEKEEAEENCHLLITTRRTDAGRDKNKDKIEKHLLFSVLMDQSIVMFKFYMSHQILFVAIFLSTYIAGNLLFFTVLALNVHLQMVLTLIL